MSADDENKISENRRRLFKALSTAPVVMTLRPGSALANASAYQCLIEPPTPATPVYLDTPTFCVANEPNCVAYVARNYWEAPATQPCLNAWEAVVGEDSNATKNVVIYDEDTSTLRKLTLPAYTFEVINPTGWSVTGATLTYPGPGSNICELDAQTGYFLLKVLPNDDLTDFTRQGPVPEAVGDAVWKSCWNSFDKPTDGVFFVQG
jgi:hypothetical protein